MQDLNSNAESGLDLKCWILFHSQLKLQLVYMMQWRQQSMCCILWEGEPDGPGEVSKNMFYLPSSKPPGFQWVSMDPCQVCSWAASGARSRLRKEVRSWHVLLPMSFTPKCSLSGPGPALNHPQSNPSATLPALVQPGWPVSMSMWPPACHLC